MNDPTPDDLEALANEWEQDAATCEEMGHNASHLRMAIPALRNEAARLRAEQAKTSTENPVAPQQRTVTPDAGTKTEHASPPPPSPCGTSTTARVADGTAPSVMAEGGAGEVEQAPKPEGSGAPEVVGLTWDVRLKSFDHTPGERTVRIEYVHPDEVKRRVAAERDSIGAAVALARHDALVEAADAFIELQGSSEYDHDMNVATWLRARAAEVK